MIKFPTGKFKIIYADPPYKFGSSIYQDGGRKFNKSLNNYYPTLSLKQIKELPVQNIADENCILFCWTTDSHIPECLEIINAWSFKFKTIGFVWVKKYKSGSYCYNFSPYTLKSTEICLIGLKGLLKNIKKSNNIKSLVFAERTKHSKKPDCVRDRIVELCGDLPRIELFARNKTKGWTVWGNEIND